MPRQIDTWNDELALVVRALNENNPAFLAQACSTIIAAGEVNGPKLPGYGQIIRIAAAHGIPIPQTPHINKLMREMEPLHHISLPSREA